MTTKHKKILGWLCPVLFLAIIFWGNDSSQAQTIGKVVDQSNWQEYEALLTPAYLQQAKKREMTFQTGQLRFPFKHWDRYLEATEKNAGKFDVDKDGLIIDKATGKLPKYNIYGLPFPEIDPKDPNAPVKIMWNVRFQQGRFMGAIAPINTLRWVGRTGREDRYFIAATYDIYYTGRFPGQEIKTNPLNLYYQYISAISEPMDLKNTNGMSWEYWDLTDTTVYSYIPVIRRVRRSSGSARSDPYMGSDTWNDNKDGFMGKIQAFTWKLLGERTLISAMDGLDKQIVTEDRDGAMTILASRKMGYETPGWKGAPWAVTSGLYWVPRPVWIIEGVPKNPYYAWGKYIMYIDKEVYNVANKETYDKAGLFRMWQITGASYREGPSGNNTCGALMHGVYMDLKADHATATHTDIKTAYLPLSRISPNFFGISNFLQMSK